MVTDFQKSFRLPAPDVPTILSDKQVINRAAWIAEELIELIHGTSNNKSEFDNFYDELLKRMDDTYRRQLLIEYPENKLVAQSDAFVDILYFANGGFVELGIDPEGLFQIVHQCNMSKLFNGEPRYNEVGKVIKSPDFIPPEPLLEWEISRQVEESK
jgi:predicted HAD superfamily Cof-like phosphohydrolase